MVPTQTSSKCLECSTWGSISSTRNKQKRVLGSVKYLLSAYGSRISILDKERRPRKTQVTFCSEAFYPYKNAKCSERQTVQQTDPEGSIPNMHTMTFPACTAIVSQESLIGESSNIQPCLALNPTSEHPTHP